MVPYSLRTADDLTTYLTDYPQQLTFGDQDPAAVFSRYHTDDFVLYNDGVLLDKQRLLAHVKAGRRNATHLRVEVHHALVASQQVAARYTLTAVMRRGQVIATDVHMFGELSPDRRLRRVEQLTRDVSEKQPSGPS